MANNFTASEVFLGNVQDTIDSPSSTKGQAFPISDNTLLFQSPSQFLGKTMWKIKNNSTGEDCVAIFPGINVDCSSEKIEVVHTGKFLGEGVQAKTPYLLVMGNEKGIQGMMLNVK
jgi:hypothetical protein